MEIRSGEGRVGATIPPPDIRWEGHSHQEIYYKVHAGPGTSGSSAAQSSWQALQGTITEIQRDLAADVARIGASWQGRAAESMTTAMIPIGAWLQDTISHTGTVLSALAAQAGLAGKLRNDMPEPPPDKVKYYAPGSWGYSWADNDLAEANAAHRAVELMNAYTGDTSGNEQQMASWAAPPPATSNDAAADGSASAAPSATGLLPAGAAPAGPVSAPAGQGAVPGTPGALPAASGATAAAAPELGQAAVPHVGGAGAGPRAAPASTAPTVPAGGRDPAVPRVPVPGAPMLPSTFDRASVPPTRSARTGRPGPSPWTVPLPPDPIVTGFGAGHAGGETGRGGGGVRVGPPGVDGEPARGARGPAAVPGASEAATREAPGARTTGGTAGGGGMYPPATGAGAGRGGQNRSRPSYLVEDADVFADDRWFTPQVIRAEQQGADRG